MKEFVVVWYEDNWLVGKTQGRKVFAAENEQQAKAMWDNYIKAYNYIGKTYYGMYEIKR